MPLRHAAWALRSARGSLWPDIRGSSLSINLAALHSAIGGASSDRICVRRNTSVYPQRRNWARRRAKKRKTLLTLAMKGNCEKCRKELAPGGEAFICTYECTFCGECAEQMRQTCPNCGGELVRRPRRRPAA